MIGPPRRGVPAAISRSRRFTDACHHREEEMACQIGSPGAGKSRVLGSATRRFIIVP